MGGCTEDFCLAEIGGALGADLLFDLAGAAAIHQAIEHERAAVNQVQQALDTI